MFSTTVALNPCQARNDSGLTPSFTGLVTGPHGASGGGGDHYANFLEAVRARDPQKLHADIEEDHLSSAYCHLGNIAYRLGRKLAINPSTESFVNDPEADALLSRVYRAPFVVPDQV